MRRSVKLRICNVPEELNVFETSPADIEKLLKIAPDYGIVMLPPPTE